MARTNRNALVNGLSEDGIVIAIYVNEILKIKTYENIIMNQYHE